MIHCTVSKDLPSGLSYFHGHKDVLACTQEGIILLRFLTLEHAYYVYFKDRKVLGFMEISLTEHEISRLLLADKLKGRGMGKLLYLFALDDLGWFRSGELLSKEAFPVWCSLYQHKGIFIHSFNVYSHEADHVYYDDELQTLLDENGNSFYSSKHAGNTVLVANKTQQSSLITPQQYPNVIPLI